MCNVTFASVSPTLLGMNLKINQVACTKHQKDHHEMQVDVDGNGTIEFPEFLELMKMKAKEVKIEYFDQKYRQRQNELRR